MKSQSGRRYFLGADVGSTKTHVLIADDSGKVAGFGESGPGNHEGVGYDGLAKSLCDATDQALKAAGCTREQITGAGFGVAGFDWPSEKVPTLQAISTLGLKAPVEAVNDTDLGVFTASEQGWGIAVVSGTGCNCRGWDQGRKHYGMVTGAGMYMGEAAGASELVQAAVQAISHDWSLRGPTTQLTRAFVEYVGAQDVADFLEGLVNFRYFLEASAAPLVFQVAESGDKVAVDLLAWAGIELGEMVKAVARQLEFGNLVFDVVMVGSMFKGGNLLIEPMRQIILEAFPQARLLSLTVPPVVGAVLLGMELVGARTLAVRQTLISHFL